LADNSKDTRKRDAAQAGAHYEADAQALRDKSARLKALRLAKEAADLGSGLARTSPAPRSKKKPAEPKAKPQALSEWLKNQQGSGHRS
jgi:hypothetical protein